MPRRAVADVVDSETRSRMMAGIGRESTAPEVAVRKWLHAHGFRFRINQKDLPGRPDIVLRRHNAVIFVHGCFWHAHEGCRFSKIPATRSEFWIKKFDANRERDARKERELLEAGWRVAVVWECATRCPGFEETLERLGCWLRSPSRRLEFPNRPVTSCG